VALVHPVVVVSRVVAVLAGWRVATASPVLVMCWSSFVQEGFMSERMISLSAPTSSMMLLTTRTFSFETLDFQNLHSTTHKHLKRGAFQNG
jgi:hypothetical protein